MNLKLLLTLVCVLLLSMSSIDMEAQTVISSNVVPAKTFGANDVLGTVQAKPLPTISSRNVAVLLKDSDTILSKQSSLTDKVKRSINREKSALLKQLSEN